MTLGGYRRMLARMSTETLAPILGLTAGVASEIRAILGRQSVSRSELARRLNVDDTWVGKRLNGRTEINLSDLERIAGALGVTVVDLFPRSRRRVTETFPPAPVTRTAVRTMRQVVGVTRPHDGRPVGRSAGSVRPDGSRRAIRTG